MFRRVGDRLVRSLSFGDGPGTLFGVAGSFANWETWVPVFERLSPRWRVVGLDHDGVGQTKVDPQQITYERQLETVLSVLDAQDIERCVIVGDSNNAALAIEAVLARSDRFAGLGIVNGHAWGFDFPDARRFATGLREHFETTLDFFVRMGVPGTRQRAPAGLAVRHHPSHRSRGSRPHRRELLRHRPPPTRPTRSPGTSIPS